MKRILVMLLTLILLICGIFSCLSVPTSAASEFYFNGTMSKEVLRKYLSRAVTQEDLVISNCFDEDMRMLRRIGAKYIGRTTLTSWTGAITSEAKLDAHYNAAEEKLAKAHALDPEMIFQAGIFEIVFEHSVECLPIPAYVFEAFGQPVVSRNFEFDNIAFPKGTVDKNGTDTGVGCWSTAATSGVPDITQLETKMYFYYLITRYIDVGFEAIHMGQAEKMMLYRGNSYANHWDELLTKARSYAKTHARRGIVLFDYHNAIDSGGIKVGDRLIFDVQAAGLCPNETVFENNAMKCEVTAPQGSHWLSWVGRSAGGTHPLGFTVENNFTILEFDNYGNSGTPGVATHSGFMNWGFDDVTWFALQPEWYRNQFLKETDNYLKSHCLDSQGNQQYFLQPVTKRYVTVSSGSTFYPRTLYVPGKNFSQAYMDAYAKNTGSTYAYNETLGGYMFSITGQYCANRNSDACPNGFNQEDTIREIFLGGNAAEDPSLQEVSLPSGYTSSTNYVKEYGVYKMASEASSSDKVLSNLFVTKQGYEVDIYGGSNKAWWEIDNGQYFVLKIPVSSNATTLKLQNLNFDSANKFKIELSPDNKTFYTIVDSPDGIDNANLEAKIENQYFKNIGENATALSKASIENGKKIVYLKISTYPTDGSTWLYSQIRIRSFDIATTRGATVSTTGTGSQFYYAQGACQSTYSEHSDANEHCFEKYVVRNKSNFAGLYYMVKLDSTYQNVVFKFDLADSTTSFTPYLYQPETNAKIKIEASKDGNSWKEIISPITITGGHFGDTTSVTGATVNSWTNLKQSAVESVLANNPTKTVYLRYSYAGAGTNSELHLQNFGISATYTYDVHTYYSNGGHLPGAAATCTTAQYCTICNTQLKAATGHSYGTPTYTWTNYTACKASRTCSCGYTQTQDATITSSVTKAATCTATGTKTYTAKFSNSAFATQTKTETIAKNASNHTGSSINGGTSGVHTKYSCCGATISTTHSYTKTTQTAATCTEKGTSKYTCSCGYSYTSQDIAAKGHTSTNGGTSGVHTKCSVCGTTISSTHSYGDITYTWTNYTACKGSRSCSCGYTQTVSATITNEVTKAATCTATGTKKYTAKFSNSAFATQTKTESIAATGHTAGAAATCTISQTCTVCGTQLVAAKGHTEVTDKAVAATCTTAGKTEGKHCSVCNTVTVAQQTVAAKGHTPKTAVTENNVNPTCTASGSYDTVVYCDVCNAEISRVTTTVAKLGHSYNSVVTAPTCETSGYTTNTCSACGDTYVSDETSALGHTAGVAVKENESAPDCVNKGSYENVVYCTVCGNEISRDLVSVDPTGHTAGEIVVENNILPTCAADGYYDNVVYCVICGDEISRVTVSVSALGHNYNAVVTAPTCETEGFTTYTCSVCGDTYKSDVVAALGHKAGEVVMENNDEPDCENLRSYDNVVYCTVCGAELKREKITVKLGDCNLDDEVNILDLIAIKKAILDDEDYVVYRDFNNDSNINSLDLTAVKKYLFEDF